MFKKVVVDARLKKEDFKTADKQAYSYNRELIVLDGRMDVKTSFKDRETHATVYVKAEAPDQLLLSKAVCQQLGIIHYHPYVVDKPTAVEQSPSSKTPQCKVKMIQTVRLPVRHLAVVPVKTDGMKTDGKEGMLPLEPASKLVDTLCP